MGYLYIAMAAALWALIGPVARALFATGMTPVEVAFFRALIGGGFFLFHATARQRLFLPRTVILPVVAFGAVGVAFFYLSYQLAVEYGGAALASVLLYTAPAWVAVLGALILKEPMHRPKVIAVGLTVSGVMVLVLGSGGEIELGLRGVLWGMASGLGYALYYIFGKLYFARHPAEAIYALALLVGAALLLPFVRMWPGEPLQWAWLAVIGFASTYLAYAFYARGLARLEATRASVVATLEPVLASLFAYLWWGEQFTWLGYVGAAMVLGAVLLVVVSEAK